MLTLAGNTEMYSATAASAASRRVFGASSAAPMPTSATPEAYVYTRGLPGNSAGTIESNGLGAMKCSDPIPSSIAAIR